MAGVRWLSASKTGWICSEMAGASEAAVKATDNVVEPSKSRLKYVQGAIPLFVERGYAGTSIDDIAKALGVTKAAVYFHFKDKAGLLHQCLVHADAMVLDPLVERIRKIERRGLRFDNYIYWWASIASVYPYELLLPILMSVEFTNKDTETTRYLGRRYDRLYALIQDSILPPNEGGQEHHVRANAMTLIAITDGMLIEWHRRGRTADGGLTAKIVCNTLRLGFGLIRESPDSQTRYDNRWTEMNEATTRLFQPSKHDLLTGRLLPACSGQPPYFEDYQLGDIYTIGPRTVNEDEILRFGQEFDRQYIHTDPQRAKNGPFGAVIASGWHTMSLMMQMLVGTVIHEDTSIASPGVDEISWRRPVFPGDVLTLAVTLTKKRQSSADSRRGLLRFGLHLTNQNAHVVMTAGLLGYLRCRPQTQRHDQRAARPESGPT